MAQHKEQHFKKMESKSIETKGFWQKITTIIKKLIPCSVFFPLLTRDSKIHLPKIFTKSKNLDMSKQGMPLHYAAFHT